MRCRQSRSSSLTRRAWVVFHAPRWVVRSVGLCQREKNRSIGAFCRRNSSAAACLAFVASLLRLPDTFDRIAFASNRHVLIGITLCDSKTENAPTSWSIWTRYL